MKFSTTIKRKYWLEKMEMVKLFGYFIEYKDTSPFWNKRISKLDLPCEGVFLVGRRVYRTRVENVGQVYRCEISPIPTVLTTEKVWALTNRLECSSCDFFISDISCGLNPDFVPENGCGKNE